MSLPPNAVQLALLVRRGQLKLADIPEDQRTLVWAVMNQMTDAQEASVASAQVKPRRHLGRSHVATWGLRR